MNKYYYINSGTFTGSIFNYEYGAHNYAVVPDVYSVIIDMIREKYPSCDTNGLLQYYVYNDVCRYFFEYRYPIFHVNIEFGTNNHLIIHICDSITSVFNHEEMPRYNLEDIDKWLEFIDTIIRKGVE